MGLVKTRQNWRIHVVSLRNVVATSNPREICGVPALHIYGVFPSMQVLYQQWWNSTDHPGVADLDMNQDCSSYEILGDGKNFHLVDGFSPSNLQCI